MKEVVWTRTLQEKPTDYVSLSGDESADLVVIGGGYCGLSIAIHAAKAGSRVTLLEAGIVGGGASGRNGGYNVPQFPGAISPSMVEAHIGKKKGSALADLVVNGANAVFEQIREFQIQCSPLQNGWMQPCHSESALARSRKVYEEWKALGVNVSWHSKSDVADILGTQGYLAGWSNSSGGTVNPYGLTIGLARVATQLGVTIHENSPADEIREEGTGVVVMSAGRRVTARMAIVATNGYSGSLIPQVQKAAVPVFLYHVATKPLSPALRDKILRTRLCFTDLRKSGGFGRLDPDGRIISGGAVFDFGDRRKYGEKHGANRLRQLFPALRDADVEFEDYWEGFCAVTETYLPYMQRVGKNIFGVGGFSTRGVNMAQNVGRLVGEFAAGKKALDDVPISVTERRQDVPYWSLKKRAARYIFPYYQMKDRLGLT